MAQKVEVLLIDDISGEPADETVRFGLDGKDYEIDLTAKHALALRENLA
ncbi:MAG: histone-like nucleoid-structuring protein Lsr2, partial [Candidatus Binatia bacterium]